MRTTSLRFGGISPAYPNDVEVPIAELGGARVVALTGENGAGKSILMGLLMPAPIFREFPPKGPGKPATKLAQLATRRDSFVELGLGVGDDDLIARVMINGAARQKANDVYLFDGKTLEPLTAEKNGKTGPYDAAIKDLLPGKRTYLAGPFAAQGGAGRFGDIPVAKRRDLFAELLGLGHLQASSEAAKTEARAIELRLGNLEGKAEIAKASAGDVERLRTELAGVEATLATVTADREIAEERIAAAELVLDQWRETETGIAEELRRAEHDAAEAIGHRQDVDNAIDAEDAALALVKAAAAAASRATASTAAVEADAAESEAQIELWRTEQERISKLVDVAEADVKTARDRLDEINRGLTSDQGGLAKLEGKVRALDEQTDQRGALEQLTANDPADDDLDYAREAVGMRQDAVADQHRAIAEWQTERTRLATAYREAKAKWGSELTAARADNRNADRELDQLREASRSLEGTKCDGEGEYSECILIENAVAARGKIPAAEKKLEQAEQRLGDAGGDPRDPAAANESAEMTKATREGAAQPAKPPTPDNDPTYTATAHLDDLQHRRATAMEARAKLEAIEAIEQHAAELRGEIAESGAQLAAGMDAALTAGDEVAAAEQKADQARADQREHAVTRPAAPDAEHIAELRRKEIAAAAALAKAAGAHEAAVSRLNEIGDDSNGAGAAEALAARVFVEATETAAKHAKARPEAADKIAPAHLRELEREAAIGVASAKVTLDAAEKASADLERIDAEIKIATADLDDWRHLQLALGPKGIQALEIDAAGPEVSDLSNDLLLESYGPRWTVELRTLDLTSDGRATKENFTLSVIDSEVGIDGTIDDLSIGQQVLVGEALSLAICVYNTRRSGKPMEDLFRDECAGALSHENSVRYVEMLRRALDLGGFNRVWYVAHQPHLWALADARLHAGNQTVVIADPEEAA